MKKRNIVIISVLIIVIFGLSVGLVFLLRNNEKYVKLNISNKTTWKVEQNIQTLGYVERDIPSETKNEGLCENYPLYGIGVSDISDEEKENLFEEDKLLRVGSDTYDSMDANGNLYLNGVDTGRDLYKHTASVGMYLGDVSGNEKAVVQKITICPSENRNYLTGLFAPAGEIVKIEISADDLANVGSLTVAVGQCVHRNFNNTIKSSLSSFSRMPNVANFFEVKDTTIYVGSFLGGPIYLKTKNLNVKYTVTISGAVRYPIYIHGYTTKEDLKESEEYSTPYFDFELQSLGVRHSGPKKYASLDFENLYNCGELWKKICMTSRQVPSWSNKYVSVGFLYDSYVAAGAACAWPGNNIWVNAPCSWLSGGLNYDSMVQNGFWGIIHEFNHHFQSYGMDEYLEVTNNATSLLSYISYTDISSFRSEGDTLSWWNRYTSASHSLSETLSKGKTGQKSLNAYADILHTFGLEKFISATNLSASKHTVDAWFEAVSTATHYDMSYYFEEILGHTISDELKSKYSGQDYPVFVPVAMLYQSGRDYVENGSTSMVKTIRPYTSYKGNEVVLDFEKNTVLPDGFDFELVNITDVKNGQLLQVSDKKYKYIANNNYDSDEFYIKIKLKHNEINTPDVTFLIELDFRENTNITKTKYTYSSNLYTTTKDALDNNFDGYNSKNTLNEKSTFLNGIGAKQIGVVEGKIYISKSDTYNICLRAGRGTHSLFVSYDGKNYIDLISFSGVKNTFEIDAFHTVSLELTEGQYVWFKQITISNGSADAYTELGWSTGENTPVTIPSQNLFNENSVYKKYTFESDTIFEKEYLQTEVLYLSNQSQSSIYSVNNLPWDSTTQIENILDDDESTFFHTKANNFVSKDNPCEIVVDLGTSKIYNNLLIVNRQTNVIHMPVEFKLYGGKTLDDMQLLGDYANLSYSGYTLDVSFDETEIRYYKIIITDTKYNGASGSYNKYVSIAELKLRYVIKDAKVFSCDEFEYYNFKVNDGEFATFGHLIEGNGYLTYEFEGNDLILYTRQNQECKIEVEIDGVKKDIVIGSTDDKKAVLVCQNLNLDKHLLKIKVLSGNLRVDSFAITQN